MHIAYVQIGLLQGYLGCCEKPLPTGLAGRVRLFRQQSFYPKKKLVSGRGRRGSLLYSSHHITFRVLLTEVSSVFTLDQAIAN